METFMPPRVLIPNPDFAAQRRRTLAAIGTEAIEPPLRPLIEKFNRRSHCFTLQCCWGHFVYAEQLDPLSLAPLPAASISSPVTYRIAYVAVCLDTTAGGRALLKILADLVRLDPANIQFGSPEWFWRRQVNTYALQVEPERFSHLDQAILDPAEAMQVQSLRNDLFAKLLDLV